MISYPARMTVSQAKGMRTYLRCAAIDQDNLLCGYSSSLSFPPSRQRLRREKCIIRRIRPSGQFASFLIAAPFYPPADSCLADQEKGLRNGRLPFLIIAGGKEQKADMMTTFVVEHFRGKES